MINIPSYMLTTVPILDIIFIVNYSRLVRQWLIKWSQYISLIMFECIKFDTRIVTLHFKTSKSWWIFILQSFMKVNLVNSLELLEDLVLLSLPSWIFQNEHWETWKFEITCWRNSMEDCEILKFRGMKVAGSILIEKLAYFWVLENEYHIVTVFLEPAFGDRRAVRHNAAGQTHCTHVCPQPYYPSCKSRVKKFRTCACIWSVTSLNFGIE